MRAWVVVGICLWGGVAASGKKPPAVIRAKPAKAPVKAPAAVAKVPKAAIERLGRGWKRYAAGEYGAAAKELGPLAQSNLINKDVVLYLLAQSEALTGKQGEAMGHFAAVGKMGASGYAARARARAADMAFALGKFDDAKRGYESLVKGSPALVEGAVVKFRLAEISARGQDKRAAVEAFRRVYDGEPQHPLAERALERMKELDEKVAIGAKERVQRAKLLTGARRWPQALEELALVPADAPPDVRDEADYWIGTTHFKMRHGYDVAAQKLQAVAERLSGDRQTEALFHGARAWSRADQDDKAIAGYRDLTKRFPRAKQAAEASFLIGWLEYNRAKYKEALPGFEETIRKYGGSTFAEEARWYHGLSLWLMGDAAGALADFEMVSKRSGALDGGKGRYWKGRALQKLGRQVEAIAVWRQIPTDFPFTYYALSARARLAEAAVKVGPFGDGQPAKVQPVGEVDEKLAKEAAIAGADELLEAGMGVEAGWALDAGDGPLVAKHGARVVPILLDRYVKSGNYFRSFRLAEGYSGGALKQDPHAVAEAEGWWKYVYPLAYRAEVEKYAPAGKNPPYYLYTIMQKESAYNPHDVSYADAIGLLQMIPPTSRKVAERIGRPYTEDILYDPDGNIQFGSWYIGHLLEKFKGQIPLGAGSYNAGPKAMMRWVREHGDHPLDEFIELCAYTQTREYMKKALDIYARYIYLYEKQDFVPQATVDAKYLENEIDY